MRARVKALEEGQVHRATPVPAHATGHVVPENTRHRDHVDRRPGETVPGNINLNNLDLNRDHIDRRPGETVPGNINLNERNLDLNPLADAEKALKKLRANPNDKQAADALERALKQLKVDQKKRIRIRLPESPENGKKVD
jgi:hypothetical protein